MKKEEQNKLRENHESIFTAMKKVLTDHGLEDLEIAGLELESKDIVTNESGLVRIADIDCPKGFKKVIKIHPITREQKVVCERI